MDSEIKAKLLELLMSEMDDVAVSKLKKPEPPVAMEVEMEAKEVSPEEIKEKMMPSEEPEMESEDDYEDSRLMQRLKELKAKKM